MSPSVETGVIYSARTVPKIMRLKRFRERLWNKNDEEKTRLRIYELV